MVASTRVNFDQLSQNIQKRSLVCACGHVDQGKSALVCALTGQNMDRLLEEKRRGISIALGFAKHILPSGQEVTWVDVPGHESLVRTMICGASAIAIGVVVIDAEEGPMPQTYEHIGILTALAKPHWIIAITKVDTCAPPHRQDLLHKATLWRKQLALRMQEPALHTASIVLTSAHTGEGLSKLNAEIETMLAQPLAQHIDDAIDASEPKLRRPACLAVDRSFIQKGVGWIVTGTCTFAPIQEGSVLYRPVGQRRPTDDNAQFRIRSIQEHGQRVAAARPHQRAAFNLIPKRNAIPKAGDLLTLGPIQTPPHALWLAQVWPWHNTKMLAQSGEFMLHIGTSQYQTRYWHIPKQIQETEPSSPNLQPIWLLLALPQPRMAYAGERFILRQPGQSGMDSFAGGQIVDPLFLPGRRRMLRAQQAIAAACPSKAAHPCTNKPQMWLDYLVQSAQNRKLSIPELIRRAPNNVSMHRHIQELHQVTSHAAAAQSSDAKSKPKLPPKSSQEENALDSKYRQALVEIVRTARFAPPTLAQLCERLQREHGQACTPSLVRSILGELERQGGLTRISTEFWADTLATTELIAQVKSYLHVHKTLRAAEFKTLADGISRKWAMPWLEFLDKARITQRRGDLRHLHPSLQASAVKSDA